MLLPDRDEEIINIIELIEIEQHLNDALDALARACWSPDDENRDLAVQDALLHLRIVID